MPRVKRRLFNLAAAVSLMLCVATAAAGLPWNHATKLANVVSGSFGGPMRSNLCRMLDGARDREYAERREQMVRQVVHSQH
jgi:hypothetical protein